MRRRCFTSRGMLPAAASSVRADAASGVARSYFSATSGRNAKIAFSMTSLLLLVWRGSSAVRIGHSAPPPCVGTINGWRGQSTQPPGDSLPERQPPRRRAPGTYNNTGAGQGRHKGSAALAVAGAYGSLRILRCVPGAHIALHTHGDPQPSLTRRLPMAISSRASASSGKSVVSPYAATASASALSARSSAPLSSSRRRLRAARSTK